MKKLLPLTSIVFLLAACGDSTTDQLAELCETGKVDCECWVSGIESTLDDQQIEEVIAWGVRNRENPGSRTLKNMFEGIDKESARTVMGAGMACRSTG